MSGSVEVCIVSYNSAPVIRTALDRVAAAIPGATVAIREHGSDRRALTELEGVAAASPLEIRLDVDPHNPGFGAGCNALAAGSDADWLLFLNPDADVLTWPWSDERPPPVDTIVGPVMDGAGQAERHWGVTYRIRDEIARSWLRRSAPRPRGRGFVSGAALLVDRVSFERIGGFDERYFMFYEDIDLCVRANDAGIGTVVDDGWAVRHHGAHSTTSRFGESLQWSYDSACRFHATRGSPVAAYRLYVCADSMARATLHLVRRNTVAARAYIRLAKRAAGELVHRADR